MKLFCLLIVSMFLSLTFSAEFGRRHYDGYQVFTVGPLDTPAKFNLIKSLVTSSEYDFWSSPKFNGYADIMAAEEQISTLTTMLENNEIVWKIKIENVGKLIDNEHTINEKHRAGSGVEKVSMHWEAYHKWDVIEPWIQSLATTYPGLATVTTIGKTYEGRNIHMVKVSTGLLPGGGNKKVIFIDGSEGLKQLLITDIHAREWISGAVASWILNELLSNSVKYEDILNEIDFYIVPYLNIDGYEYCHDVDRMWRKTRSANPGSSCRGCDPNRNFAFQFGGEGTSPEPCSFIYHGPAAFSESETAALRDALNTIMSDSIIWAYMTIHSYGQLWLLPWGYTQNTYPDDYPELLEWGQQSVEDMKAIAGRIYTTGQGADLLYGVGGASDDYAKSLGIKYTVTAELRDEGAYGFLLPSTQIESTAQEMFAGVLRTARTVMTHS